MKSCIFIILAINFSLYAVGQTQSMVTSASANNIKGGIALSWTLGQVVASNSSPSAKPVIQTQELTEKLVVKAIDENSEQQAGFKLYPNPATDILNIQVNGPVDEEMAIAMIDSNGNQIINDLVGTSMTPKQINLKNIPSGIYYIRVTSGNAVKIFKVVKL